MDLWPEVWPRVEGGHYGRASKGGGGAKEPNGKPVIWPAKAGGATRWGLELTNSLGYEARKALGPCLALAPPPGVEEYPSRLPPGGYWGGPGELAPSSGSGEFWSLSESSSCLETARPGGAI